MKENIKALNEAIEVAGGTTNLARLISCEKLPVAQNTIGNWRARGSVPADYCPAIERETGIACERLNNKVDWAYLRCLVP